MPYTSGTTGVPKGCMHTHRSTMHTLVAGMRWFAVQPEMTLMAVAPFFHVTGMQGGMNGPLYVGNTVVLLPRWDRDAAAECVQRYRIASWTAIPTMMQDFFCEPEDRAATTCPRFGDMSGGGAAMPAAVAQRLEDMGVTYVEGLWAVGDHGGHAHQSRRARRRSSAWAFRSTTSTRAWSIPITLHELPAGEVGEIVTHGPQVFWATGTNPRTPRRPSSKSTANDSCAPAISARIDEEGYFFMVDRLKRMINASGFKVWPTEVESLMYQHPAVQEACVIGAKDAHRGETVKAVVVLGAGLARPRSMAQAIIDWCRAEHGRL